jgi:molecular chaperone GrpE|tara:strand:+ start:113 stop:706 length:594 start_codon:yes stop_codon:yes gene_type:complete
MVEDNKKNQKTSKSSSEYEDEEKDLNAFNEKKELTIEEKLKETEDKLLRSLAEIENQRRRFEKEIKDAFEFGSFNFAKESLASLDNIQRAKESIKHDENLKTNKDLDKFLENFTIVEKDLVSIFEKNGIKKIETKNKKFDPNLHQAMSEIEDKNAETGIILQEIQAGYLLAGRLLRPALVAVAKKNDTKNNENKEEK